MTNDILNTIKDLLTSETIMKAGSFVGESPATTQKAMDGIVPTLLAGLLNYSSTGSGANRLLSLVSEGNYGNLLNNLSSNLSGGSAMQDLLNSGREILSTLFGGKLNSVVDLISNFSGIKSSSASSLLSMAAPLILGVLAKEKTSQGLNASSLASLLLNQKNAITSLAPPGLAGILGLGSMADLGSGIGSTATRVATDTVKGGSSLARWLLPLLLLCVLVAGLIYALKGRKIEVKEKLASVTLPGGSILNLAEGSFNYNLARFLANQGDTAIPKTFVFDHLNFESGTTQLTADSVPTINNLIAILKAYPSAEVNLVGYTDNVGDAESNKKLSQDRADAVRDTLVKSGIDSNRLTTAGYGAENPVASNDTEEGKAKNRRLELVVVKK
jgi:OmpA-OmpF porin, OOP family